MFMESRGLNTARRERQGQGRVSLRRCSRSVRERRNQWRQQPLEVFDEIQRRRSPAQKLADVFALCEGLFETVKAGVQMRHPDAGEREVFLRAVATRTSRELMIRAYGWDPEAAG